MSTTDDSALRGVDRALDRLRVAMAAGKRTVGRLVVENVPTCPDASYLLVVHAVELGPPTDHDEVTVGMVAGRLGVDPSRASRLVAGAIRAGLLRRVASQEDGRRSRLELTELGQTVADCGRRIRLELIAGAMTEWGETERAEFARTLERFTDGLCTAFGLAGTGGPDKRSPPGAGASPSHLAVSGYIVTKTTEHANPETAEHETAEPGVAESSEQAVPETAKSADLKKAEQKVSKIYERTGQETAGRSEPDTVGQAVLKTSGLPEPETAEQAVSETDDRAGQRAADRVDSDA